MMRTEPDVRKNQATSDSERESGSSSSPCLPVYTIATETHQCYGHGDYAKEQRIVKEGSYGSGGFPPCFESRRDAEKYLGTMEYNFGKKVVELRFFKANDQSDTSA